MQQRSLMMRLGGLAIALMFALTFVTPAFADKVEVKKGTDVKLAFDSKVSSKTAKVGDVVKLHVNEPVMVDNQVVIAEGTKVTGKVVKVDGRKHFGVNAKIQLSLDPVMAVDGKMIPLGYNTKTQDASRPGTAAGTAVGGAVVLGPVGLVAGYFVVGKNVDVKPGDKMTVKIDEDRYVNVK